MLGLVTGVPGSGKSLLTVGELLPTFAAEALDYQGKPMKRRLCVAGIPGLLLDHVWIDAPELPQEGFTDPYGEIEREPGTPPIEWVRQDKGRWVACQADDAGAVELPLMAENWWCWVQPGDYLVLDECQNTLRPLPSGRRAPTLIRKLEKHRHYGVDFLLITQHPNLLHSACRALIGEHRHVRRIAKGMAIIYQWDHCSNPSSVKTATNRVWRYPKKAFANYRSAVAHTKRRFSYGAAAWMALAALLAAPVIWYLAIKRTTDGVNEAASIAAGSHQVGVEAPRPAPAPSGAPGAVPGPSWPVYELAEADPRADPYGGRAFVLEGEWSDGRRQFAVFGLVVAGERVASVSLADLVAAGYVWTRRGPCAGELAYSGRVRRVTCGPGLRVEPAAAPSAQSDPPVAAS